MSMVRIVLVLVCCMIYSMLLAQEQGDQRLRDSLINVYEAYIHAPDKARDLLAQEPHHSLIKQLENGLCEQVAYYYLGSSKDGPSYKQLVISLKDTLEARGTRNTPCLRYAMVSLTNSAPAHIGDSLLNLAEQLSLEVADSLMLATINFYRLKSKYRLEQDAHRHLLQQAYALMPAAHDQSLRVNCLVEEFYLHINHAQPDSALLAIQQAEMLSRQTNNQSGLFLVLYIYAVYYQNTQPALAISYLREAMATYEQLNQGLHPGMLSMLGNLLDELGQYQEALRYYKLALQENRALIRYKAIGLNLSNIAFVYNRLGNYEQAINAGQEAINHHLIDGWPLPASAYKNMSVAYRHLKRYDSAIAMATHGLAQVLQTRGAQSPAMFYEELMLCYEKLQVTDSLKKYAQVYLQATDSVDPAGQATYQHLLTKSQALSSLGKPVQALQVMQAAYQLRDSLYTSQTAQTITEVETRYETREKEATIAQLATKQEADARNRRQLQLGLLIISVLALGLLGLVWRQVHLRRELSLSTRVREHVLSLLAHDVRSPLQRLINIANLHTLRKQNPELAAERIAGVGSEAQELLQQVDSLLLWSRQQLAKGLVAKTPIDLATLIDSLRQDYADALEARQLGFTVNLEASTVIANPEMIQVVLRNLVANAIKYTPTGGLITVNCHREGRRVRILVQDTGMGISNERMIAIYQRRAQSPGRGVKAELGKGMGLQLVQEFLRLVGSKLEVRSLPGKGSTFSFVL